MIVRIIYSPEIIKKRFTIENPIAPVAIDYCQKPYMNSLYWRHENFNLVHDISTNNSTSKNLNLWNIIARDLKIEKTEQILFPYHRANIKYVSDFFWFCDLHLYIKFVLSCLIQWVSAKKVHLYF
jgi:hypothetical protein